ncbi:TIGR02281 family clan AA aspartic protease [Novosphingobium sp. TH158]|uniref:retropepsin-like aspartic protease family protein n=1 Tax=Novosphingobium sp. TH158 TaxID=2067455 RepID=UPI000C7D0C5E|nr:TIGR02281 family clan AA aspartic protease [Novosphingobium sp. TH158]PLK27308.1 hypothetical protein C0V78_10735 [Novosphingobium sp. TH158]
MNRLMFLALSAIASMMLIAQFVAPGRDPAPMPSTGAMAVTKGGGGFADEPGDPGETVIARDSSGQFHLKARLNGTEEAFLVDTGADVVALTIDAAESAGLPVDPTNFEPLMQTASGTGHGARFRLDDFEVAGKHFRDVEVVVMEGLETNLLGQSVLRKFGKVELRGDRMVISRD